MDEFKLTGHEKRTAVWSMSTLKKAVAKDFQKLVRLRHRKNGQCKCVTCGRIMKWNSQGCHAGHFIPGWRVKFEVTNCHPQCFQCNEMLSGNREQYALFMLKRYGQREIDRLYRLSNKERKYTREELILMRREFREQIKSHSETK